MREREKEGEKENKLHYDYMGLIFRTFSVQIWIYLCFYGEIYQPHFSLDNAVPLAPTTMSHVRTWSRKSFGRQD